MQQPPIPTRPASSARSPPAVQSLVRKASDSALALKARGRVSTGAARSVSGSAIPTPVRRASVNLLDSIAHGSPGSPIEHSKALRASVSSQASSALFACVVIDEGFVSLDSCAMQRRHQRQYQYRYRLNWSQIL